jgi:uncharacterized protein (TIGR03086 family)
MDVPELHRRACETFGERVHQVGDDQWHLPTPCEDWDVRTLVNHLVYENRWTPSMFAGKTIAEVGDRFEGDLLGADPRSAWRSAAAEAVEAVHGDGAMERTVHLSFGDVPGEEYARQLLTDHLIHAWDLARAVGGDERLDPDLVTDCAAWFADREELYRGAGIIGARVEVGDDADQQTRLLAAFGRDARRGG